MKLSKRLLSLLLVCLLCFGLFSVNAFAVENSENLVDSNLSNWTDYGEESQYFQSANVSYLENNVNYIEIPSNSTTVLLFDLTQFLKIGDSYRFSFNLPTTNGYNSNSLNSCVLTWALCDGSGDSTPTVGNNVFQINIDDTNKSNYLGKTTTFEFTYTQGFQNTFLCLFVSHGDNVEVYEDLELYISDVSLNRVTSETENKLDGILGWLEYIKNSITGLGDKLTDVWTNITSSISSLGDRISSFFTELSNTITTKFNELSTNFSNYITNLGDRISLFFDNLITNVKTFFEELPRKIFNYEIEVTDDDIISDGSSSDGEDEENNDRITLDDFYTNSPNVSFANVSDGFEITKNGIDSKRGFAYLKLFVPANSSYNLSFTIVNSSVVSDGYNGFCVTENEYQTELSPNVSNSSFTMRYYFEPPQSFSYNLPVSEVDKTYYFTIGFYAKSSSYSHNVIIDDFSFTPVGGSDTEDEVTTTKVSWFQYLINKFKSWFFGLSNSIESFFIKLFEDIRSLFIPSEGYFDSLSNRFDLLIEQRFGALVTITDYLVDFFSSFNADVTKEYFDVPVININLMGYNFPIGGWQVRFVPQFNGVEILTNACKFISSVLATFAFFDGLKKKYHEVFGGGE